MFIPISFVWVSATISGCGRLFVFCLVSLYVTSVYYGWFVRF